MNIVEAIFKTCNTDIPTITRCLAKATTIIYKDGMFLIADDTTIFYFGVPLKLRSSKLFYTFYTDNYNSMKGKLFYSLNISNYKDRCKELPSDSLNPNDQKYLWL